MSQQQQHFLTVGKHYATKSEGEEEPREAIFVTGFPGFLCAFLMQQLLEQHPKEVVFPCLVQPHFCKLAEKKASEIDNDGRIMVIPGDLTAENLGIDEESLQGLRRTVTAVFHLAAVYDLGMSRELGMK